MMKKAEILSFRSTSSIIHHLFLEIIKNFVQNIFEFFNVRHSFRVG